MKDKLNEILRNVMNKLTVKEFDLELLNGWKNTGSGMEKTKAKIKDGEMAVTGYVPTHNCYGVLRRFDSPATEHMLFMRANKREILIDANWDLPAATSYFFDIKIPVKYVGGGGRLLRGILAAIRAWSGGVWHGDSVKHYPSGPDEERPCERVRHRRLARGQTRERLGGNNGNVRSELFWHFLFSVHGLSLSVWGRYASGDAGLEQTDNGHGYGFVIGSQYAQNPTVWRERTDNRPRNDGGWPKSGNWAFDKRPCGWIRERLTFFLSEGRCLAWTC